MYCHLCHTEMSPSHNGSSGHRAARELVAAALERLSNHLSAADSTEVSKASSEAETDKSAKTPEAVGFCDTCNIVYPINEQTSHYRQKKHALAVLNEQEFEELVQAYIGEEPKSETPSEASDDVAFVDESEAVNIYNCHLCALEVPRVFRTEHERSSRHRASRTFALAAARRARDTFSNADKCDGNKFSGKMMKKLLKAYTGEIDCTENIEEPEPTNPEPDSTKTEPKLTPKQYFTDILPYLPYVGTFNTLYIDNTEFVTIKIGTETLKIHVNNLNGLYNIDGKEEYYMSCRLCDGFSTVYYPSMGQQDKLHVMSLGHVKNVMLPVDNVHLIRKVDDTHSMCHLCNLHISPFAVENHILKDTRHTTALTEALELGKDFKETGDHLKIMIYMQPAPKPSIFKNNQNKWTFGIPQHPKITLFNAKNSFGATPQIFGNAQNASAPNSGFGIPAWNPVAQNTGFGCNTGQAFSGNSSAQNTGFGSAFGSAVQNAGFANSTAQNAGFGSSTVQNASFGSAEPSNFGSNAQSKSSLFGTTQNTGSFGNAQNTPCFGAAQNKTTSFGAANSGFGVAQSTTSFGTAHNASFGVAQNKSTSFGGAQNDGTSFGVANNATGFGVTQNKDTGFGVTQNQGTVFGATQKITLNNGTGGVAQNNATSFGASPNNAAGFGGLQMNTIRLSTEQIQALSIGITQKNAAGINVPQSKAGFGAQNNATQGANQKGTGIGATHIATDFGAVQKAIGSIFDNAQTSLNTQKQEPDKVVDNKQSKHSTFNTSQTVTTGFKFVRSQSDKCHQDKQTNDKNQTKTDSNDKTQRAKRSPPRKLNYSSSSSDSE
ncbi:uncharacterized protein LOC134753101 isoform X3 [Cydia strobilella]|uniref:uncharacterized protein LOC134753101 isoform X3 n=1 Tax=Cydia strobilella TaxID=1100964 RepID=UPI003007B428